MKSVEYSSEKSTQETSDRRIRRTKMLLRSTLTGLLMEKDLKDITIRELTERADINRGTFYLHYKDIYDLFDQIEKETLEDFQGIISQHKNQKAVLRLPVLLNIFKYVAANAELFIAILRTRETNFLTKVLEMNIPKNTEEWRQLLGNTKEEYYEYYYAFITSGCIAMVKRWFAQGMHESPECMAKLAEKMMANCTGNPARG